MDAAYLPFLYVVIAVIAVGVAFFKLIHSFNSSWDGQVVGKKNFMNPTNIDGSTNTSGSYRQSYSLVIKTTQNEEMAIKVPFIVYMMVNVGDHYIKAPHTFFPKKVS